MPDTPNIVFVHTDQQHHQALSAYGNKWLKTPHMDRIANEGYNFMESVSSNPVCCPARTCWYTGRTSKETGVLVNSYPLQEHIPDLGQWLRKKTDYDAVYAGKWHVPKAFTAVRQSDSANAPRGWFAAPEIAASLRSSQ